jgi:hypothetical protein
MTHALSRHKANLMCLMITMTKPSESEDLKKRERIQKHFWNEVGSIEHISLPKLKNAVRREFNYKEERPIQAQIKLMQTEARIRIESRVKVWINPPARAKPKTNLKSDVQ